MLIIDKLDKGLTSVKNKISGCLQIAARPAKKVRVEVITSENYPGLFLLISIIIECWERR